VSPVLAVVFDLDDTLYPEREFVRSGLRVASDYLLAEGIARRPLFEDFLAALESGERGRTFNRVLEAEGIEPAEPLIRQLVGVYRTHRLRGRVIRPEIRLYDDAQQALERLAGQGLRLGLISDGPLECQRAKVEALDLAQRMDDVILTDEWGRAFWKPHPRAFREMAARLKVAPSACVYVADNPEKDFAGAAAAGWLPSIRVRRPDGLYRDALPAEGSALAATIETLDALPALIAQR
jgi:putative hydrolase of the HAD superfamily